MWLRLGRLVKSPYIEQFDFWIPSLTPHCHITTSPYFQQKTGWSFALCRRWIWQVLDLGIPGTAEEWEGSAILKTEGQTKVVSLNGETSGPLPSYESQKTNSQRELPSRKLVDSFLRKLPISNEKMALTLSCKSPVFLKPKQLAFSRTGFSQLESRI